MPLSLRLSLLFNEWVTDILILLLLLLMVALQCTLGFDHISHVSRAFKLDVRHSLETIDFVLSQETLLLRSRWPHRSTDALLHQSQLSIILLWRLVTMTILLRARISSQAVRNGSMIAVFDCHSNLRVALILHKVTSVGVLKKVLACMLILLLLKVSLELIHICW